MSNSNFPDYAALFGALNFKEGDEARSVYSPAAYLADLLQLMDDEFEDITVDDDTTVDVLYKRRADIRKLLLDAENSFTLIPYLGIVNEILANKLGGKDTLAASEQEVYETVLPNAAYPFNLPFNLPEAEMKLYLKYLGITGEELYKLFSVRDGLTDTESVVRNETLAREYLGLSPEVFDTIVKAYSDSTDVPSMYGYTEDGFLADMAVIENFMAATDLSGAEVRQLIYQNLSEEEKSTTPHVQLKFFINAADSNDNYAVLDSTEENIISGKADGSIDAAWFHRVRQFVKLAQGIQLSFIDLDLMLRLSDKTSLDTGVLQMVATVKKLQDTTQLSIEEVMALLTTVNETGHTENEDFPQDLFSKIFNNAYVEQDLKYVTPGNNIVPHQFLEEKDGYSEMTFAADLFSDNNYYFRMRVTHALGISEPDLEKIIQRLDDEDVDSTLWLSADKKIDLLNFLYRFTKLSTVLDISYDNLFTLLDLLTQDPSLLTFYQHNTLLSARPSTQACLTILLSGTVDDRLWLIQSLQALVQWMTAYDFNATTLWYIATGKFTSEKAETAAEALTLTQLNGLLKGMQAVSLTPTALMQEPLSERVAHRLYKTLHQPGDMKTQGCQHMLELLDLDEGAAQRVASEVMDSLMRITPLDFKDLGIAEPLVNKIAANLMHKGYTDASGIIQADNLPDTAEAFRLETDFSDSLQAVFSIIHRLYLDAEGKTPENEEVVFSVFASDLRTLFFTEPQIQELYDNLIFNHYIDEAGTINYSSFFSYPENWEHFDVNTHLQEHAPPVYQLLKKQVAQYEAADVILTTATFDTLNLTPVVAQDLLHNLTLNEYINANGVVKDKEKLQQEDAASLRLPLQFYPQRHKILAILQDAIAGSRTEHLALNKDKLASLADGTIAQWIYEDLQGDYLEGDMLLPNSHTFFADVANAEKLILGYYFEGAVGTAVFHRMQQIIEAIEPLQLLDAPLVDLKFYQPEIDELIDLLIEMNVLTPARCIPLDQVDYFLNTDHAMAFRVEGFEDFNKDIFFLLQTAAKETRALADGMQQVLLDLAKKQEDVVWEQLKGIFGLDVASLQTISAALFEDDPKTAWLQPLVTSANALGDLTELPKHKTYRKAFQRVRQYALLATKLQMGEAETAIAFQDQDLAEKFPEALAVPDGVTSINVVLEAGDLVYLLAKKDGSATDGYWTYRTSDYELVDYLDLEIDAPDTDLNTIDEEIIERLRKDDALRKRIKEDPIRQLFKEEGALDIDAAFFDNDQNLYVMAGTQYYRHAPGNRYWDRRDNPFGVVDNDFAELNKIDAAYVDKNNRLYLFADDLYVRYSDGLQTGFIDKGYPKKISESWTAENVPVHWPAHFADRVDAAFEGTDGKTYLFQGYEFVDSHTQQAHAIADHWGTLKHDFKNGEGVDAVLHAAGATYLFVGDEVIKYSDCLENDGLQMADGYPMLLADFLPALPAAFASGVDALLQPEDNGLTYVFKDNHYRTLTIEQDDTAPSGLAITAVGDRHSVADFAVITPLENVNAAMVGLDGYTYLFSGTLYYRYKTGNYALVDPGYPRLIADDWEGLSQVDAAFVLDGKTYLFGQDEGSNHVYIRYSTRDYKQMDEEPDDKDEYITPVGNLLDVEEIEVFPALQSELSWWSIPAAAIDLGYTHADAICHSHQGKTYLFFRIGTADEAVGYYLEFDHTHRWWSAPVPIKQTWPNLPFDTIDAAMAAKDGHTYFFSGDQFVRFSDPAAMVIDHGYPRKSSKFWGLVRNNLLDTLKVDALVTVESREMDEDDDGDDIRKVNMHTYLFSGDQFFRYKDYDYTQIEPGYPKPLAQLSQEPRFKNMTASLDRVDAAWADFRNVYLIHGNLCEVIADMNSIAYKVEDASADHYQEDVSFHYPEVVYGQAALKEATTLLLQDGTVYGLMADEWQQLPSLENGSLKGTPAMPRMMQDAPEAWQNQVDAVLQGTDGNTYYFKGEKCYNHLLGTEYAIEAQWGKPQNDLYTRNRVDAGFVGKDGVTYVFSGRHYYAYAGQSYVGVQLAEHPEEIARHWGGLTRIAHAYVLRDKTYVFEKPDEVGQFRVAVYHTDDYKTEKPDVFYTDNSYWDIPTAWHATGFYNFQCVLALGDNLIFINDRHFIRYHVNEQNWSAPREVELLFPDLQFNTTTFRKIQTAFKGVDGSLYLFDESYFTMGVKGGSGSYSYTALAEVKEQWGLFNNPFYAGLDAVLVQAGKTYLLAGNDYVRYSDDLYNTVDPGYPKKISEHLMQEAPFRHMGNEFKDALEKIYHEQTSIDAVITNTRNTYVLVGGDLHVGSYAATQSLSLSTFSQGRNNVKELGMIDAAFVLAPYTYLFSGDQYIRYSDGHYLYVDPGYPRLIGEGLAEEPWMNGQVIPELKYGVDAAFAFLPDMGDTIVAFTKDQTIWSGQPGYLEAVQLSTQVLAENVFAPGASIDAAYLDDHGRLLVFKDHQYLCYSDLARLFTDDDEYPKYADAGYPMDIKDHSAHLPADFQTGLTSTFRFEKRLFFVKENTYVRYTPGAPVGDDRFYPQAFTYRWGDWTDYLLMDVYWLARFMKLNEQFSSPAETLSSLLHAKDGATAEPYWALAEIFGFDKEEVRWVLRHNAFVSRTNEMEQNFKLEAILRLYDILSTTQRLKVDVSKLYNDVWTTLYDGDRTFATATTAAAALYDMLGSMDYNDNYTALFDEIERALNVIKRDALVPYAIAHDADATDARELYEKLLIDVQMEGDASTSRIKEATMAIQLFLHRFFMHLETVDLKGSNDEAKWETLKEYWEWMRNYRVWEANRKVFLYPENYLRPELRDDDMKTPAFETLEQDLRQGEINEDTVEVVYKKYLDEFTEVSRLKIAGGYVFEETDTTHADQTNRRLVLLGKTKADPIRYYYRFGNFLGGDTSADSWEAWKPLGVIIESEKVYPVYAFNRVFVFWPKVETVAADSLSTDIDNSGDTVNVTSEADVLYTVKIYFTYYDLNENWVQPQELKTVFETPIEEDALEAYLKAYNDGNTADDLFKGVSISELNLSGFTYQYDPLLAQKEIADVTLSIAFADTLGEEAHDNIVVTCQYSTVRFKEEVIAKNANHLLLTDKNKVTRSFILTPELYTQLVANPIAFGNTGKETFNRLFDEGDIEEDNMVVLNTTSNSLDAPWYAYDHKGGSFLCKPDIERLSLSTIQSGQPELDAAFYLNNTTYYFKGDKYYVGDVTGTAMDISGKWGKGTKKAQYFRRIEGALYTHLGYSFAMDGEYVTKITGALLQAETGGEKEIFNNNLYDFIEHIGVTLVDTLPESLQDLTVEVCYAYVLAGLSYGGGITYNYPMRFHFSVVDAHDNRSIYFLDENDSNQWDLISPDTNTDITFVGNAVRKGNNKWTAAFSMTIKQGNTSDSNPGHVNYQFGFQGAVVQSVIQLSSKEEGIKSPELFNFWDTGTNTYQLSREITAAFTHDASVMIFSGDQYLKIDVTADFKDDTGGIFFPEILIRIIEDWGSESVNVVKKSTVTRADSYASDNMVNEQIAIRYNNITVLSRDLLRAATDDEIDTFGGESAPDSIPSVSINYTVTVTLNSVGDLGWIKEPESDASFFEKVDAAYVVSDKITMISGDNYVTYTLGDSATIPDKVDDGEIKNLDSVADHIDAAFLWDDQVYLVAGDQYYLIAKDAEPDVLGQARPIKGNWSNLPESFASGIEAALVVGNDLTLYKEGQSITYGKDADDNKLYLTLLCHNNFTENQEDSYL